MLPPALLAEYSLCWSHFAVKSQAKAFQVGFFRHTGVVVVGAVAHEMSSHFSVQEST
jgi:hypothetical protein